MTRSESDNGGSIYQIKVTLPGIRPPIWRRLLVPRDVTLDRLHDIIQAAFGWLDYHLHQFIVDETYYGVPDPEYLDYMEMHDEQDVTLGEVAGGEGARFRYEYDFGDGWIHDIVVEKVVPREPGRAYPVCIKGRRSRPPEDVGGIWGYELFLQAIQDPEHEEHESYLEWIGGEFDPEEFDLAEVNRVMDALAHGLTYEQAASAPAGDEWRFLQLIDRGVAIIKPKQPLVDWVNRTVSFSEPITLEEENEDQTAILVPDLGSLDAVREYLSAIKPLLFEIELEHWNLDRADWPEERTTELFDDWFDIEVHSMVWDLVKPPA